MSQELDNLEAQVKRIRTVSGSCIALMQGLSAEIIRLKDDPIKLQALAEELNTDATALAAAVEANTPPAPPTP